MPRAGASAPTARFRHNSATAVAAIIMMISGLSLATWAPYLLVLLVIPLALALWTWRAGTDADPTGLTVRAVVASRRVPWPDVAGLVTTGNGGVTAQLTSGKALDLPAVSATDLPRLLAAAGKELVTDRSGDGKEL